MAVTRSHARRARRSSRNHLPSVRTKPQLRSSRRLRSSATTPHLRRNFLGPVPIWLDHLPSELCERIASFVSLGKRTPNALNLAHTSPAQERAVIAALSHAFSLHRSPSDSDSVAAWMPLFHRAGLRKLTVTRTFAKLPSRLRSRALQLLSSPTLRSAKVPDDPRVLRAISRAASLHDLTVSLFEDGPWPMDATRLLMRALTAQNLRRLDIHCAAPWESQCPLRRIQHLAGTRHALERCCPGLEAFHAHGCVHPGDPYWAIWTSLQSIREVDVRRFPPECVMQRLRQTPSVRIRDVINSLPLAKSVGNAVTHVRDSYSSPTATEIEGLSECPRLSVLHIVLEEGSEGSVLKLAPSIPSLKTLTLYWGCPPKQPRLIEFLHPSDPGRVRLIYLQRYVDITPGVMLRVVEQAPALTHLDIFQVRVLAGEVVELLKHLGGRLRHFGVSFHDQPESSIERLKTFVAAIVEHNRALCSVSAGAEELPSFMHIGLLEEEELEQPQIEQWKSGKSLVRFLKSRVTKCIPSLPTESLNSWINAVQWIEGREV